MHAKQLARLGRGKPVQRVDSRLGCIGCGAGRHRETAATAAPAGGADPVADGARRQAHGMADVARRPAGGGDRGHQSPRRQPSRVTLCSARGSLHLAGRPPTAPQRPAEDTRQQLPARTGARTSPAGLSEREAGPTAESLRRVRGYLRVQTWRGARPSPRGSGTDPQPGTVRDRAVTSSEEPAWQEVDSTRCRWNTRLWRVAGFMLLAAHIGRLPDTGAGGRRRREQKHRFGAPAVTVSMPGANDRPGRLATSCVDCPGLRRWSGQRRPGGHRASREPAFRQRNGQCRATRNRVLCPYRDSTRPS